MTIAAVSMNLAALPMVVAHVALVVAHVALVVGDKLKDVALQVMLAVPVRVVDLATSCDQQKIHLVQLLVL